MFIQLPSIFASYSFFNNTYLFVTPPSFSVCYLFFTSNWMFFNFPASIIVHCSSVRSIVLQVSNPVRAVHDNLNTAFSPASPLCAHLNQLALCRSTAFKGGLPRSCHDKPRILDKCLPAVITSSQAPGLKTKLSHSDP